ncbi:aldo/keto reductase [Halopelagius longus]|uniref:Aldo/keto reductase n=1 Tax=Halopelagius longus TaxID=1236180 RepID=A0A1H1D8I2_9EURY|nr:aldo/keto reductase [Halopelagius longus]RDI71224.1 aldo/keto reductase [Halopelagius longus]SDQ72875.1 Predicted oxidoreductase [Halopelagius longus]
MATKQGTWGYRDRFGDAFGRTYFRRFGPGVASSIGVGTYLGDPTDEADDRYRAAVTAALDAGVNLVDTAINYRCQRSERVVGEAIRDADADREEVVVATKGGFVPFDGERPADPGAYVRDEFVSAGLVDASELARGSHAIAPDFLSSCLDRSLSNLELDGVDLYYVHNPETQLTERSRADVYDQLEAAFEMLERRRDDGDVGAYGVATWNAFRVPRGHDQYLSLPEVVSRAESAAASAGVEECGLAAIQLPFNVTMADAFTVEAHRHPTEDRDVSALWYAHEADLDVVTSATLGQGELAGGIPAAVDAELAGDTAAQRAVNFARSAPGVKTALVGTGSADHVAENVAAGTFDPMGARAFDAVFE